MRGRPIILLALLTALSAVSGFCDDAVSFAEFALPYRPGVFELEMDVPIEGREVVFKKEPVFGDRRIVRGAIPVGLSRDTFVGFAWDEAEKKLYIDLNRNLDLTDDPTGVVSAAEADHWAQTFRLIKLQVMRDDVPVDYLIDMSLRDSTWNPCEITVRSGWRGEVRFADKSWILGVVDNLDGVINADDRFILTTKEGLITAENVGTYANQFPASRFLILEGRPCKLDFRFEQREDAATLRVGIAEAEKPEGLLTFEHGKLSRIILDGPATIVIDSPEGSVAVPPGRYTATVYVDGGKVGAFVSSIRDIEVAQGKERRLSAGGPLSNTVHIVRNGSVLNLDYALVGAGGELYQAAERRGRADPEFAVYMEGEKIAGDQFDYG